MTGLGHQAVMIFFVLSGFMVGGSVIAAFQGGRWSFRSYWLRRLTRLWVVFIPALLLTFFWDKLGQSHDAAAYAGVFRHIYNSGPTLDSPASWSPGTFVGNLAFLQTILVPCFGSNSPAWSLANEFWYYFLFPVLISVALGGTFLIRASALLIAVGLMLFLPHSLLTGGVIWLLGAGVFLLIRREWMRKTISHALWLITSLILAIASLAWSRSGHGGEQGDLLIGITFSLLIGGLSLQSSGMIPYRTLATGLSEISYTLYLVHFPIMAFFFFSFFKGTQIQPDLSGFLRYFLILATILFYSGVVWWCFERNTDRFRKYVAEHLPS